MKKTMITIILAAVLLIAFALSVYAETEKNDVPQWFQDMITWKKEQVAQALKSGEITEAQAKQYYERIDQMMQYHIKNGFKKGFGSCHSNKGNGQGIGAGMMNGASQMMRGRF